MSDQNLGDYRFGLFVYRTDQGLRPLYRQITGTSERQNLAVFKDREQALKEADRFSAALNQPVFIVPTIFSEYKFEGAEKLFSADQVAGVLDKLEHIFKRGYFENEEIGAIFDAMRLRIGLK